MLIIDRPITKRYYSTDEVAKIVSVSDSTIRYWCDYFEIHPAQGRKYAKGGRQRRFTPENISDIQRIKYLVQFEGFRLEGAKRQMKLNPK